MEVPSPFLARLACARRRWRYAEASASEMRCAPVELDHWLINKREAQRSPDMVSCRQEAGPFVLSTKLGLLEMADHP